MNRFLFAVLMLLPLSSWAATDSYRWLHVTIETPWFIFLFLLPMVLMPAIVMAVLYWRYVTKKPDGMRVDKDGNEIKDD